jgi:ribosomal protein S18 acetylase RimI-like enzyme
MSPSRRRIAVISPYFPYPLSHGGAVRIFHLLREMAAEFDVFLLSFSEGGEEQCGPVLDHCARVILVDKPRYREPRWATLRPPEVGEYASPAMRGALARILRDFEIQLVQVEYTALAPYAGDVLVEHDVTFHLYEQVYRRAPSLSAWWDLWRWRRFERTCVSRYRRVVVMSDQDRARLGAPHAAVIPNGVDLERFRPEIERPGHRLLFIGSFRPFPNVVAYRFFVDQVWPLLKQRAPDVRVTVVAGPEPELYWREQTGLLEFTADDRIALTGFVADVRPLYVEANLVMVPTLVSAGTNLKVLEALAMERAVISTSSGCAGLGLEHGKNVWIADSDAAFADGIERLFTDRDLRERVAFAGRVHAEAHFGWPLIGRRQRALVRELLAPPLEIRRAAAADIPEILSIQSTAPEASQWTPDDYLTYDCHVAIAAGRIGGFLVSRQLAPGEREILNVAVHPEKRRTGIASALIRAETERWPGVHFLEVRSSNQAARRVYHMLGFEEISTRADYYDDPPEAGIVMRFRS